MIWQDPVDYSHITYEYDHSLLEQVREVLVQALLLILSVILVLRVDYDDDEMITMLPRRREGRRRASSHRGPVSTASCVTHYCLSSY